jgi:hypothetical protein
MKVIITVEQMDDGRIGIECRPNDADLPPGLLITKIVKAMMMFPESDPDFKKTVDKRNPTGLRLAR